MSLTDKYTFINIKRNLLYFFFLMGSLLGLILLIFFLGFKWQCLICFRWQITSIFGIYLMLTTTFWGQLSVLFNRVNSSSAKKLNDWLIAISWHKQDSKLGLFSLSKCYILSSPLHLPPMLLPVLQPLNASWEYLSTTLPLNTTPKAYNRKANTSELVIQMNIELEPRLLATCPHLWYVSNYSVYTHDHEKGAPGKRVTPSMTSLGK